MVLPYAQLGFKAYWEEDMAVQKVALVTGATLRLSRGYRDRLLGG